MRDYESHDTSPLVLALMVHSVCSDRVLPCTHVISYRFVETYPDNSVASALPFAMNSEFSPTLAKEMVRAVSLKMEQYSN